MKSIFYLCIFLFYHISISQEIFNVSVYFDTDIAALKTPENKKIDSVLSLLDINKIYEININAYCDDRADSLYNINLSQERANYVKNFFNSTLKNKRIRTLTSAWGEVPLQNSDNILQQRNNNRRADIQIVTLPDNNITRIEFAEIGDKVILQNILFEANRHKLLTESKPTLDSIAQFLKENNHIKFNILGHICCRKKGSPDATDDDTGERRLSENRAKYIYLYLKAYGIDPNRMEYKGMKANYPLGKGDFYDRRVELEIINK